MSRRGSIDISFQRFAQQDLVPQQPVPAPAPLLPAVARTTPSPERTVPAELPPPAAPIASTPLPPPPPPPRRPAPEPPRERALFPPPERDADALAHEERSPRWGTADSLLRECEKKDRQIAKQAQRLLQLETHLESLPSPAALLEERQMLLDEQKGELSRAFARKNRDAAKEEIATIWSQLEEQSKALEAAEQRAKDLDRMSTRVENEHTAEVKALRSTLAAEHAAALVAERAQHDAALATRDARAEEGLADLKIEHAKAVAALCVKLDKEAERMCHEAVDAALARNASSDATTTAATPSPPSPPTPPSLSTPPVTSRESPEKGAAELERMRSEMRELREMSLSLATTLAEERRLRSGSLARLRGEAEVAAADARKQAHISDEWQAHQTEEYERRLGDVLATSLANQRAQLNAQHARELDAMRRDAVSDALATQRDEMTIRFRTVLKERDARIRLEAPRIFNNVIEAAPPAALAVLPAAARPLPKPTPTAAQQPQWPDAWSPRPAQHALQAPPPLQQPQELTRSSSPAEYHDDGAARRQTAPSASSLSASSPMQLWLQRNDKPPAAWLSAQTPVPPTPPPKPAQQPSGHGYNPFEAAASPSESRYPRASGALQQHGHARPGGQSRVHVRRTGSIYVNT